MIKLKKPLKIYEFGVYIIITVVVLIIYYAISNYYGVKISDSKHFNELLSACISGVSILLGIFGVLFTCLISLKDTSIIIKQFFYIVDKRFFIKSIKRYILIGISNLIISAILLISDIILNTDVLVYLWLFTILLYIMDSFRFINILMDLITEERNNEDDEPITAERRKILKGKIENMNKR